MEEEKTLLIIFGNKDEFLGVADNEKDAKKIFNTAYPKITYSIYRRLETKINKIYYEKK